MIMLLQDYLRRSSQDLAEKTAIQTSERSLTYRELDHDSDQFAKYLKESGVCRGDRIVIGFGNVIETIIAFWGVLKADAIVSIINQELAEEKINYIMQDSGAKQLCTDNREIIRGAANYPYRIISRSSVEGGTEFNQILSRKNSGELGVKNIDMDLASIIYTSGSTGEPKGVMMTHRNMIAATESINAYLNNQSDEVFLCVLPLAFDYGLYQMIMSVCCGATLILEKNFLLPLVALRRIATHHVTAFPIVPSMLPLLQEFHQLKNYDLSSVKYVTNTGAALSERHISLIQNMFKSAKIYSMYGVTESKRCTYLPPNEINKKPNSVGKAIPNTEIFIVDEELKKVGANRIGQLVVRGATVMRGYWNKPEATLEKLAPGFTEGEMLLYTGDYGYLDEDGYFYFKGRIDEMLKIRGVKVSPKEIEDIVLELNGIVEAAIVEGLSSEGESEIHLFISQQQEGNPSKENIKTYLRGRLEKEKIPAEIHYLKTLPKTSNGKIDKLFLREKAQNSSLAVA